MRLVAGLAAAALGGLGVLGLLWAMGRARQIGYEEARVESWAEVQGMLATGRLRLPEDEEAGDFGAIPGSGSTRVTWTH